VPILLILLVAVIILFLAGGVVIGWVLELLWLALVGLVIGALARLVLPGIQGAGALATILAGIAGSFLGGIVGDALDAGWFVTFLIAVAIAAGVIALLAGSRRSATV
jgi:uncharacterized membrane protein YeaQ/YmgE (transglycosylase-associated protein family)